MPRVSDSVGRTLRFLAMVSLPEAELLVQAYCDRLRTQAPFPRSVHRARAPLPKAWRRLIITVRQAPRKLRVWYQHTKVRDSASLGFILMRRANSKPSISRHHISVGAKFKCSASTLWQTLSPIMALVDLTSKLSDR